MPIKIVCPKCKKTLQVSSKMAGKQGKCQCGHSFTVPSPQAASTRKQAQVAAGSVNSAMFDELTDSDFARRSPFDKVVLDTANEDVETLKRFTHEEVEQKKKQAGATRGVLKFLSLLSLLVAIFSFTVAAFFVAAPGINEKLAGYLPLTQVNQGVGIAIFVLLGLLLVAAGVGLFLQASWGWIAIAAFCVFMIVERGGAMGLVFQSGFEQMKFFSAMGPLLGVLFLTLFIFKGDTQEVCKIKNMIPVIIAVVIGLALGGAAVGAMFSQGTPL